MDRKSVIFRPLQRFAFACTAGLLTSVAAYAAPVVTISAYGIDQHRPYGYQRVGTTDDAEVSYASQPFVVPLGAPAGFYPDVNYPATFQGFGYANGSTGVLKASASSTGAIWEESSGPCPKFCILGGYVTTEASASGVITVGGVDGQAGTITVRQQYDGAVRLNGTIVGYDPKMLGGYHSWVWYRKVGETTWNRWSDGDNFLSPTSIDDSHEFVFNAIAGERYEIYEGLSVGAIVNFGATTEVDFSHTSILSITSSGGITVSGQDGFLADLLNQPVNSVPEPTSLALLLAGLSAGCFGWRKKQA